MVGERQKIASFQSRLACFKGCSPDKLSQKYLTCAIETTDCALHFHTRRLHRSGRPSDCLKRESRQVRVPSSCAPARRHQTCVLPVADAPRRVPGLSSPGESFFRKNRGGRAKVP